MKAVYLFGSVKNATAGPTSDIDLLLHVGEGMKNRGELLLRHRHDGVDLKYDYARETLRNLLLLWKRPVNLETHIEGTLRILRHDGTDFSETQSETESESVA